MCILAVKLVFNAISIDLRYFQFRIGTTLKKKSWTLYELEKLRIFRLKILLKAFLKEIYWSTFRDL